MSSCPDPALHGDRAIIYKPCKSMQVLRNNKEYHINIYNVSAICGKACNVVALLFIYFYIAVHLPGAALAQDREEYVLALENENGKILLTEKLSNNSSFAVRFIHSVAKTPVTDYFIIRDGKIILDKTIYHDFGAGLPHNPEQGQKMKAEHGEISITGFNRLIPELALRVGRVAEHTLLLFDEGKSHQGEVERKVVPLATIAKPGSVILFRILPSSKI